MIKLIMMGSQLSLRGVSQEHLHPLMRVCFTNYSTLARHFLLPLLLQNLWL